jgi:hypothetical protein
MNNLDNWNAICTINYFLTGEAVFSESDHPLTDRLYRLYLHLEVRTSGEQ